MISKVEVVGVGLGAGFKAAKVRVNELKRRP
jgi:hypothetical protein